MTLPRITVRRLMVVVAIAARISTVPRRIAGRRDWFRKIAGSHVGKVFPITRFPEVGPRHPKRLYHIPIKQKHHYSYYHFRFSVALDPPVPPGPE